MNIKIPLIANMAKALATAWEEAKEAALEKAEAVSPKPGQNPYATGRYKRSWRWLGTDLINTAPYEKYTDTGATRYGGPGTAKPWKDAGATPYSSQAFRAFGLVFRAGLKAERIIRGR